MNFDQAFEKLIGHEGRYSNHSDDPGGETMFGITKATARQHGYNGAMIDLPLPAAKLIYKSSYWDKVRCDELPDAVRFDTFDAAVNSGTGQAVKFLQRAAGVADDGVIGPRTLAAVRAMDPQLLDKRISGYRLQFMADLKNWPSFGKGWVKRIAKNMIED